VRVRIPLLAAVLSLAGLVTAPAAGGTAAVLSHRPIVAVGANQSNNWSGYNQGTLEKGGTLFHQVSGDWVVPTATAHKRGEAEYSSTWIGIGGGCVDANCIVTDSTLIQAGTEQDVDASGNASYSAWWELIPAPGVTIDTLAVKAGDHVHVDIREAVANSEVWTFTFQNVTTGKSWTQTVPYSSTYGTAEWIEETPVVIDNSGNVSVGPLPSLSTVRLNNGQANSANPNLISSEAIQLVDFNNVVLATPSAPDPDKNGFNDCSYATSCAAPTSN